MSRETTAVKNANYKHRQRMKRILHRLLPLTLISAIPFVIAASYPNWWYERGAVITNGVVHTNDFAAINAGQVKTLAVKAAQELEAHLPGGAGPTVQTLVNGFQNTNNYAAVNAGQVKNIAAKFYDRLIVAGYTNAYPWANSPNPAKDFAPVNIGQVKNLFAFDLTKDVDADGLPDLWEVANFGDTASQDLQGDADGDGYANVYEFRGQSDPSDETSLPPPTMYVSLDGAHTPPFDTWAKAATNIQAALDVAPEYAVIMVDDGVYMGNGNTNLQFPEIPVVLTSLQGAEHSIIDCQGQSATRGVIFSGNLDKRSALLGFTIRNADSGDYGGGIYCTLDASPLIARCVLQNCHSLTGGGISVDFGAKPEFASCLVIDCVSSMETSGGVECYESEPIFRNCTLAWNAGSAICVWSTISLAPQFENCIVWSPETNQITVVAAATPIFTRCVIRGGWSGAGTGNLDVDPLLAADGSLTPDSVCIDAGVNNNARLDVNNEQRHDDPWKQNQPSIWDIGADEYVNPDDDADGLPDSWELCWFGDITSQDGSGDPDGDGLTNLQEYEFGTNPLVDDADTDQDGMPDVWELRYGLNPLNPADAAIDADGDGLSNLEEFQSGTKPNLPGDGLALLEEARERIRTHWNMVNSSPLTFNNPAGSPADLQDMAAALNQLSGKFYTVVPGATPVPDTGRAFTNWPTYASSPLQNWPKAAEYDQLVEDMTICSSSLVERCLAAGDDHETIEEWLVTWQAPLRPYEVVQGFKNKAALLPSLYVDDAIALEGLPRPTMLTVPVMLQHAGLSSDFMTETPQRGLGPIQVPGYPGAHALPQTMSLLHTLKWTCTPIDGAVDGAAKDHEQKWGDSFFDCECTNAYKKSVEAWGLCPIDTGSTGGAYFYFTAGLKSGYRDYDSNLWGWWAWNDIAQTTPAYPNAPNIGIDLQWDAYLVPRLLVDGPANWGYKGQGWQEERLKYWDSGYAVAGTTEFVARRMFGPGLVYVLQDTCIQQQTTAVRVELFWWVMKWQFDY